MNAAIYLRVSSARQDEQNQEAQVRALCTARGYTVADEHVFRVVEKGDAAVNAVKAAARAAAHAGVVRVIVVWALDRWTREGIIALLSEIADLRARGCALVSVQEPWADTTNDSGAAELLLAIAAWAAKWEKRRLIDRTQQAIERIQDTIRVKGRAVGKKSGRVFDRLGRPRVRVEPQMIEVARQLRATLRPGPSTEPISWRAIRAQLIADGWPDVPSHGTLQRLAGDT